MVWERKTGGARRDRVLRIRVSAEEAAIIEEFAAVAGLSISKYVREVATRPGRFRMPNEVPSEKRGAHGE
jgi:hypothetical protein